MTINEILGSILAAHGKPLSLDDSPETLPVWDSLRHVAVILAVEDALGADLTADEISKLNSIRDIMEVFRARGIEVEL
jgi:acyl carrier protein